MLCRLCKKNQATVHLQASVGNELHKIDLCESCAKAKRVDDPTGVSLAKLLLEHQGTRFRRRSENR